MKHIVNYFDYITENKYIPQFNDNFWKWFGNSKVVDNNGNPLIVYHGTKNKFKSFDIKKSTMGIIWFSSDREEIESGNSGAVGYTNILSLYASIQKAAGWNEYEKYGLGQLLDLKYDGVILPDGNGNITGFVFYPNQLKSISNDGTWSLINDNIYK